MSHIKPAGKANASKALVVGLAISGLLALGLQPANAAVANQAESPVGVEINETQISEGSLADRVRDSGSLDEAVSILEASGFSQESAPGNSLSSIRYEKTVDGITVGFELPRADPLQPYVGTGMQPYWGAGWNWGKGGPYVKGTLSEWQAAARNGAAIGGAACVFITATTGAFFCAAAVGVVSGWIGSHDTSNWPSNVCIAVSGSRNIWFEAC